MAEIVVDGPPEFYHFFPFCHRLTGSTVLLVGWRLSEDSDWRIFVADNGGRVISMSWKLFLRSYACRSDSRADLDKFKRGQQ